MKAQTELLLYMLAWGGGKLLNPSLRCQLMGYEEWAYRNGFLRQIQHLEAQVFLEKHPDQRTSDGFTRVTDAGLRVAMGGAKSGADLEFGMGPALATIPFRHALQGACAAQGIAANSARLRLRLPPEKRLDITRPAGRIEAAA